MHRVFRNHEPRHRRTRYRQTRANQHYHSESKYKCSRNRFLDGNFDGGTENSGHGQASQLDFVRLNLLENTGRQQDLGEAAIQAGSKGVHHHNPEDCNRKYPSNARNGVIDSRSCSDTVRPH